MKTIENFLSELSELDIKFSVEGDRLLCSAPKGAIGSDLRDRIAERKPEILTLLKQIYNLNREKNGSAFPQIKPDKENAYQPFPLNDIQQAYLLGRSSLFELSNVATHVYLELESSSIEIDKFEKAWQQLIDRHPMLRAIIRTDGQQQILEQVPPYKIKVADLRNQKTETANAQLAATRQRLSHQILPAEQWPLFEICATQLNEKKVRYHISFDLLIGDGRSAELIGAELAQLIQNPEKSPPPLELSFRDYILAELDIKKTPTYRQALDYWQHRLATLPPAPELPLKKNLAAVEQPHFHRRSTQLDPATWGRLKNRASQARLTPSALLLAAFAEILTTWSKNPRFTINLTLFNRLPLHPEVNQIVGDFTSLTLLEIDNSGADSFEVRGRRIQQQLWNDLDRRYVSGVQVLRELARSRGRQSGALMPVVFTSLLVLDAPSQNTPSVTLPGEIVYTIGQTPQVYLDHQVQERDGGLILNWDAVEELFPNGLLDDMFAAYCYLLEGLANSEQRWQTKTRQLLPQAQLQQITAINATDIPLATEGMLLHTLFFERAEQYPQQTAIVTSQCTFSYQQLSFLVVSLARQLQQKGARPNQLVAVVMEKGWEQVVAVLGILTAGAAYVPVDPALPAERRQYLCEQTQVQWILTQSKLDNSLEWPEGIERVCIDQLEVEAGGERSRTATVSIDPVQKPEDIAYIIYTSGSTGMPKGVTIDHRGAVNTILDINQRFGISEKDRIFALSSLSFDLSVYDIFGTLAAGGTIVIPDADSTRDPAHWMQLLEAHRVTVWNSVPALMQMLCEYATAYSKGAFNSLRLVLLSGDWIPLNLSDRIKNQCREVKIVSLGGATEASIWSILYPIETVDPHWKSIPYGRPMTNQHFYVLDEALQPRPVWVPGQLYIGGIGLAKGYWQNEEKTASSFIVHPQTQERLYRTGDLGCYLPDGTIEFIGREDFQVKVGGYRIELGEIEATLERHPTLTEAIVTAVGDVKGNKQLVAHVVSNCLPDERELDKQLAAEELREFLQKKLPAYMVPARYIFLDKLPLTPNGKVDRRALPAPELATINQKVPHVEPRTPTERLLVTLWMEVLEVESVGAGDNFFELGGDSLLAIKFISEANKAGLALKPTDIFQHQTIAELAEVLSCRQDDGENSSAQLSTSESLLVAIQTRGDFRPLFCVAPATGNVDSYFGLASYLAPDRPAYGLKLPAEETVIRLEEMAMRAIATLRERQPQGPYFLAGHSMGGIVAYEMAQQLYAGGHQVALLALLDVAVEDSHNIPLDMSDAVYFAGILSDDRHLFSAKQLQQRANQLQQLEPDDALKSVLEEAKQADLVPPGLGVAAARQAVRTFKANLQALRNYTLQPYPGKVALFKAGDRPQDCYSDSLLGWGKLALAGVELRVVPGDHVTILRQPNVSILAEQLKICLQQANTSPLLETRS